MAQKGIKTSKQSQKAQTHRQEGRIARWWRETIGELRKVNWPTTPEALRLTRIVLIVMLIMSLMLGFFDFIFSRLLALFIA